MQGLAEAAAWLWEDFQYDMLQAVFDAWYIEASCMAAVTVAIKAFGGSGFWKNRSVRCNKTSQTHNNTIFNG